MATGSPKLHFQFVSYSNCVLQKMNSLREQRLFCDVTIRIEQASFQGHKVVLAASSPFLRDQFLLKDTEETLLSINQSPEVVTQLLQSCYTGVLEFPVQELISYLTVASYLQMGHVVEKCQQTAMQYMEPSFSAGALGSTKETIQESIRGTEPSPKTSKKHKLGPQSLPIKTEEEAVFEVEGCPDVQLGSSKPLQTGSKPQGPAGPSEVVNSEDFMVAANEFHFQGLNLSTDFSSEARRSPEQEVLQGPYLCLNCSLTFQFLENYVSHMREHKLFLCLRCGKTFTQKGNLTRHIRMHTGFKPYQCSVCTKTFTQKVSLQDHVNLHSGTRPHCCNYCKLHFAQKPALRRHLREMHRKSIADNFNEEVEEVLL
ncbi:zinc finger and BTB domain-containing protein 26-like [Polyodon spathula]|uniref:zinc finger and BTB domain-containing protein 26-like n=1 Tax=Polyodon spathula TaxID=7913 RepID=UPI001B7E50BD|nr:zinc finger and BTB domain-containing protein 26-like [Polyodon spathula]